MKTISKNARLRVTALVFGAALITGVESKAMHFEYARIMNAIGECLDKTKSIQVANASGSQIDLVATARQRRIEFSACLDKLPSNYQKFNNGFGAHKSEVDQNGEIKPVRQLVCDERKLSNLYARAIQISNESYIVETADYVPNESKAKATEIKQAACYLARAVDDFSRYQSEAEYAYRIAQGSWLGWFLTK